ncbi:CobW family GTP-binding protein [Pseudooceanicola nanhaiensis]|uniref:CobW family GTP-binding protein n=1 Tax=Pseudooceanicola nanhaiensis TaxID=375761 RepID=UPI001CD29A45|nr:GTP-binding protein [Pseudooceanicola nanhaiensis]MCA0919904.1 GTP-binding protein [Pseudooceanicola nanhaiensis]
MISPKAQCPVYLLTGFLGAGKTTLLNRLMDDPALQDTALVINEFGLVPVDHDLVREGREQPMVTTAGCICCTVGSDLRSSLDQLLQGRKTGALPPFSRVIVETTGLADPAPIINSLIPGGIDARSWADHAVARAFRLSGVITLVNVEGIGAALAAHPESLRQIAFADHVILTHTETGAVGDWPDRLRAINGAARLHDAADPGFDPASLLEAGSYQAFGKGEDVTRWLAAEASAGAHAHGGAFHDLNRHGRVLAVPLTRDAPLEEADLRGFLDRVSATPEAGLLRIKGLVALRDDPSRPAVVHGVGHRLYPTRRLEGWPDGLAQTRLVLIGTGLDEEALRRDFAALGGEAPPFMTARPGGSGTAGGSS